MSHLENDLLAKRIFLPDALLRKPQGVSFFSKRYQLPLQI